MIEGLHLGPAQFWGLAFAFSLLLLIGAVLLWVLGRMVDTPGPKLWGAGAVLADDRDRTRRRLSLDSAGFRRGLNR